MAASPEPEPKPADATVTTRLLSSSESTNEQILNELRKLTELTNLQAKLLADPPLRSQALWIFLLQVFGLIAAALFGVFSVLAWRAADQANSFADSANALSQKANGYAYNANRMANAANQIAIAAYCQNQSPADLVCTQVASAASASIRSLASSYFNGLDSPTSSATGPSTGGRPGEGAPASRVAGIVVGVIAACIVVGTGALAQHAAYKKRRERSRLAQNLVQGEHHLKAA